MMTNRKTFFEVQKSFPDIPFSQTEEWLDSIKNNNICYFVDNVQQPRICCWGRVYNRKLIGNHLLINGISMKNVIDSKNIRDFFKSIISEGFKLIELSDINYYNADFEVGIRRAGFLRPLGSTLSPLTLIVNLQSPFSFHRDWRRNVRKAIEQDIQFEYLPNPTIDQTNTFIRLFNQLKERKNLGFTLTSEELLKLLSKEHFKLFFAKTKEDKYLAGRLIYVNKKKAYDIYAANSYESLKNGSTYFLQEKIFYFLKEREIEFFDYGRIPPGTDSMDDIYVAKSYSGGYPILYNGQWQYSKSILFDYLYSFYKHCILKRKRY